MTRANSKSFMTNTIRRLVMNNPNISPADVIARLHELGRTEELSIYRASRIMDHAKRALKEQGQS